MERSMQFMTSLFGGSAATLLNSAFALGIVLVAIVLGLWGLKLLTKATSRLGRDKHKRLVVVDKAMVDSKRQVVIVRRDNVEHVIMTGGPQDLVIESGVPVLEPAPPQPRRAAQRPAPQPQAQPAAAAARPADISRHAAADRPVTREEVDRLRDLARPAPLPPRPSPAQSLRHTNLLRSVTQEAGVIPMGPSLRVDNSAGPPADSDKTGPDDTGGPRRFVGRRGPFRSIGRRDG
jgi:flagellar biogenesis protein FliO